MTLYLKLSFSSPQQPSPVQTGSSQGGHGKTSSLVRPSASSINQYIPQWINKIVNPSISQSISISSRSIDFQNCLRLIIDRFEMICCVIGYWDLLTLNHSHVSDGLDSSAREPLSNRSLNLFDVWWHHHSTDIFSLRSRPFDVPVPPWRSGSRTRGSETTVSPV